MNLHFHELSDIAYNNVPIINTNLKNVNTPGHFHKEFELVYVESGKIIQYLNLKENFLEAGDIVLVMPGCFHSYKTEKESIISTFKFTEQLRLDDVNLYKIRFGNYVIHPDTKLYDEIHNKIKKIKKEYESKPEGYQLAIKEILISIIVWYLRNKDHYEDEVENKPKVKSGFLLLNMTNDYIEKNYMHKITLDEIAEYCNYSRYYYSRRFKEITSRSFVEYLTEMRIKKAIEFMATGIKNSEIAEITGFGDKYSFNRAFKKYMNCTPTEYKSKIKI